MTPQGARARAHAQNREVAALAVEVVRQSASRRRSMKRCRLACCLDGAPVDASQPAGGDLRQPWERPEATEGGPSVVVVGGRRRLSAASATSEERCQREPEEREGAR